MLNNTFQYAISPKRLSLICCVLAVGCMNSKPVQVKDELPTAETVLAKFVEATGGQAAYDKINNSVVKRTVTFPSQNVEMTMTIYRAKPNKGYFLMESAQTGKIEEGGNGEITWGISPQTGSIVHEGKLYESTKIKMALDNLIYWQKYYKNPMCYGLVQVDGKDCYLVQITPKVSDEKYKLRPENYYFEKETGLLLKTEATVITATGEFGATLTYSDFREINGFKKPFKSIMEIAGQTRVFTIQSIEYNVELSKNRFDLPDEIKNLVNKNKSAPAR